MSPTSSLKTGAELRRAFLDFFVQHGHTEVPSSPLVPHGDPTLMFTTAGMVQFKPYYSASGDVPYTRATSVQKCLRLTDLDNVGLTPRHDTFFEMLGNFSFGPRAKGAYFKDEAIALAWAFLTNVLMLPRTRLHVSIFGGEPGVPRDDEAAALWKKLGLPAKPNLGAAGGGNTSGPPRGRGAGGALKEAGAPGQSHRGARAEGQLRGSRRWRGRVRAVQRDLLRPGREAAGVPAQGRVLGRGAGGRGRPLHGVLEPGVSAVRRPRRRHARAAAEPGDRHRDGDGAPGADPPGEEHDLRDRPVRAARGHRSRRREAHERESRGRDPRRAHRRRSRARAHVRRGRGRAAGERGRGLRAPPPPAPRGDAWPLRAGAGAPGAVSRQCGGGRDRAIRRPLPRAREPARARPPPYRAGGDELRAHLRGGHAAARAAPPGWSHRDRRPRGVRAPRHVRVSDRAHRGDRGRARRRGGSRRLRGADGEPARAGAGRSGGHTAGL